MACFAFMTHTNSPEIALRFAAGPSSARHVLAVQTLVLWAVYCGIAVCGYMSFLEDTKQPGFFDVFLRVGSWENLCFFFFFGGFLGVGSWENQWFKLLYLMILMLRCQTPWFKGV